MNNSLPTSTYYIQQSDFAGLSLDQFYQVAKLRQDVFILEQQSIYADLDGLDTEARHFLCWSSVLNTTQLMGYARYRLCKKTEMIKIERVVLNPAARGKGLGKLLMQTVLQDINTLQIDNRICLSAQVDAEAFYRGLGFVTEGESYDDGGIEHVTMCYRK